MRMMACVICASGWKANHCIACVTASTSMVRLEVMALWDPLKDYFAKGAVAYYSKSFLIFDPSNISLTESSQKIVESIRVFIQTRR